MQRKALAAAILVGLGVLAVGAVLWLEPPSWLAGGDRRPSDGDDDGAPGAHAQSQPTPEGRLAANGSGSLTPSDPSRPPDPPAPDPDRDLHGVVVDGNDAPVADADLVTVTYPFDRANLLAVESEREAVEGVRARSAKDGTFSIRLRRGAVVALRVVAPGFAPVERPSCRAGERVRIVLRPGVSLVVEATGPEGGAAAEAEFRLTRYPQRGSVSFRRSATTGADGRARFDDLPPGGAASLEVSRAVWMWSEGWSSVLLPETGEATVRVAFQAGRAITGRVTDAETKAAIEGARVGVGWWAGRAVTTDVDGRYTLPGWGYEGVGEIHVLAKGYGCGHAIVGTASVLDFALSKGDSITGRVVDPDGKPLASAVVAAIGCLRSDRLQTTSRASGTSGPDGRFALADLRHDMPHTLVVMATGRGRTLLDLNPRPDSPGPIDVGDIVLPTGRVLSGRILRADGAPVADAQVELKGANSDRGRLRAGEPPLADFGYGSTEETTTAEDGRFAFADLAPGTYAIEAYTPGMPSRQATVKVGPEADPAPVELRFPEGRLVRVTVVDDEGVPVPSACLVVEGGGGPHNMAVDLDAQASATLLIPDSVKSVRVGTWGGNGSDPRRFLDSDPEFPVDPKASEMRCVLQRGRALTGRVLGPDGTPRVKAGVQVCDGDDVVAAATTDDDGRFDVSVPIGGPYVVRLDGSAGGFDAATDSGLTGSAPAPVEAADIVIHAQRSRRDLRQVVRVVDADDRPVAGATVTATWARTRGHSADFVTDADGRAELSGLPDLLCSWTATPAAGDRDFVPSYAERAASPSSSAIEIRMRTGVRLRGRVVLPPGAFDQGVRVDVLQILAGRRKRLKPGETTFSMLLDPVQGESGYVAAYLGPDDAPTHTARVDILRFGEGEVLLTLVPVR